MPTKARRRRSPAFMAAAREGGGVRRDDPRVRRRARRRRAAVRHARLGERRWSSIAAITMTLGNSGRGPPGQRQAHARVLVDRARRLPAASAWCAIGPRRREREAGGRSSTTWSRTRSRRWARSASSPRSATAGASACSSTTGRASAPQHPARRARDDDLPAVARRRAADRRLLRQVLRVQGAMESTRPAALAGRRRRRQQRRSASTTTCASSRRCTSAIRCARSRRPTAPTMRAGLLLTAIAVVLLGIFPSTFVDWAGPVALK